MPSPCPRRRSRATRVAMGQNSCGVPPGCAAALGSIRASPCSPIARVDRDVLVEDGVRLAPCSVRALTRGQRLHLCAHAMERGPSARFTAVGRVASSAAWSRLRARCPRHTRSSAIASPYAADRADQRGAAHPHPANRERGRIRVAWSRRAMRNSCGSQRWSMTSTRAVGAGPDRAVGAAVHLHRGCLARGCGLSLPAWDRDATRRLTRRRGRSDVQRAGSRCPRVDMS